MVRDSKVEGEEKWGGAYAEGGSWYKRFFGESKEKGFWNYGRWYFAGGRLKVWGGGFLASLRALHLEREGSKKRERRGRRRFEDRRRGFQQERLRRKREEDSHLKSSWSCWIGALLGMTIMNPLFFFIVICFPFSLAISVDYLVGYGCYKIWICLC